MKHQLNLIFFKPTLLKKNYQLKLHSNKIQCKTSQLIQNQILENLVKSQLISWYIQAVTCKWTFCGLPPLVMASETMLYPESNLVPVNSDRQI